MKIPLDKEKLVQFKMDVAVLHFFYTYEKMGIAMKVDKSNFSHYLEKNYPLTEKILENFYKAWDEKLKDIYRQRLAAYSTNPSPESIVSEDSQIYTKVPYRDELISTTQKNHDEVLNKLNVITDTSQQVLALLKQKGENPDNKRGEK